MKDKEKKLTKSQTSNKSTATSYMQLSCNKHTNWVRSISQATCHITSGDPTQLFINAEASKCACRDQAGSGVRLLQRSHHICMRKRNVYAWLERRSRSNTLPPTALTNVKSFFPVDHSNLWATRFEVIRSRDESSIILHFHNQYIGSKT